MITPIEEQLIASGWREHRDQFKPDAHAYFKRFPVAEGAECHQNGDRPGIQVGAYVYRPQRIRGHDIGLSVAVELTADAGHSWVNLHSYSLGPETTEREVIATARRLVAAWETYVRFQPE